jgi:hypothetical protein
MAGKILYCVLVTTKQNQPFVELVTDKKPVADLYQKINIDKGLFSVVVEKKLNQLPKERRK